MDGGVDRACRGASTTDNSPSNYVAWLAISWSMVAMVIAFAMAAVND